MWKRLLLRVSCSCVKSRPCGITRRKLLRFWNKGYFVFVSREYNSFTTNFFDSWRFKSKRLWKRFQDFRQSYRWHTICGSTLCPGFEQFKNGQMYKGLKIAGLNYRISRKPCSSKASNGLQQSQSIDCIFYFAPDRWSLYEESRRIYLAPETQLTRQIDISLYYLEDNRG